MRNFESLEAEIEGLTPDDPHAPRHYGRDLYADDDRLFFCHASYCQGHLIENEKCDITHEETK